MRGSDIGVDGVDVQEATVATLQQVLEEALLGSRVVLVGGRGVIAVDQAEVDCLAVRVGPDLAQDVHRCILRIVGVLGARDRTLTLRFERATNLGGGDRYEEPGQVAGQQRFDVVVLDVHQFRQAIAADRQFPDQHVVGPRVLGLPSGDGLTRPATGSLADERMSG